MVDDRLAEPCTGNMGVANFVSALRLLGGGAWLGGVVVCCDCFGDPISPMHGPASLSSTMQI